MDKNNKPSASDFFPNMQAALSAYRKEKIKAKRAPASTLTSPTYNSVKRSTMSINDIRSAAWNATQGSEDSYNRLRNEYRRLVKTANSRLSSLKSAGLDMFAYDRAITYLKNNDRSTFSTVFAPSTDFRGMVTQLSELISFINSKTSTVRGARTYLNEKLEKISDFTGKTYTENQKKQLGRLLGLDSVSTLLRDVRGDSAEVIDALEEIALTDVDTKELSSIIDNYLTPYIPWSDTPWGLKSATMNYDQMIRELKNLYE